MATAAVNRWQGGSAGATAAVTQECTELRMWSEVALATAQGETGVQAGALTAELVAALVTTEAGRGKQKV